MGIVICTLMAMAVDVVMIMAVVMVMVAMMRIIVIIVRGGSVLFGFWGSFYNCRLGLGSISIGSGWRIVLVVGRSAHRVVFKIVEEKK